MIFAVRNLARAIAHFSRVKFAKIRRLQPCRRCGGSGKLYWIKYSVFGDKQRQERCYQCNGDGVHYPVAIRWLFVPARDDGVG